MVKFNIILFIFITLLLSNAAQAKQEKVDEIEKVQSLINQAYQLGYVDAAPVEMDFIEKKVLQAKEAKARRKKKNFNKLIAQIKADLKIVKKRFEVNQLYNTLQELESKNLDSKRLLDDLKGQL